jgi:hypothetical protein
MARKAARRKAKKEAPRRYRWIDAGAATSYANSCSLDASAEAVFAHFGIDQRLTRRIVITPSLARQLAALLEKVVRDYEERYGKLVFDEK